MQRLFWICFAGALGTGTRYLVGQWAGRRLGTSFPYGTLIVNLLGCLLIALVMKVALELTSFPATVRLALTTGFLGGLTTYSSFNYETTRLLAEGATGAALVNLALTTVGGFLAGLLGLALGHWMTGA
jgi:CrcB protein